MKDHLLFMTLLHCPQCRMGALSSGNEQQELYCASCGARYAVVNGRPVLLRHDNAVFPQESYRLSVPSVTDVFMQKGTRFIPDPSVNLARERVLRRVRDMLSQGKEARVLVVGCGRQRGLLDRQLGAGERLQVLYSDIDARADADIYCDGHDLPFAENVFDAVITTAVLEHVLCPDRVTAEIHRVLKVGGVLYSEMPFMQQVHEGAYDFTRYTLSGHRRLFNCFSELESGMVAGPATALVWALENFALAFLVRPGSRRLVKAVVRLAFSWLKHVDRLLVKRPAAMDGASCTYFLGRKIEGRVADAEIIARYVGAKHLRHT